MFKALSIKNLNWTNGSRNKPVNLPDPSLATEIPDNIPVMQTEAVGWIIIQGNYNYGWWKDVAYFLEPLEMIDEDKKVFKYSLVRDEWYKAVTEGIRVKGTLVRTTNKKLLSDNFHLTRPLLEAPAKLNIVNLEKKSTEEPWKVILSKDGLDVYVNELETCNVDDFINVVWKNLHRRPDSLVFPGTMFNTHLPSKRNYQSWKNNIGDIIKQLAEDIKANKYFLSKVTQLQNSRFTGYWCITTEKSKKSIGLQKLAKFQIKEVNFDEIVDIVPIDPTSLDESVRGTKDLYTSGDPCPPEVEGGFGGLDIGLQIPQFVSAPVKIATNIYEITDKKTMERLKYQSGEQITLTSDEQSEIKGTDVYTLRIEENDEGIKRYFLHRLTEEFDKNAWVEYVKSDAGKEIRDKIQEMDGILASYSDYHVDPDDELKTLFTEAGEPYSRNKHLLTRMPKDNTGLFDWQKIYDLFIGGDSIGMSGKALAESREYGDTDIVGYIGIGTTGLATTATAMAKLRSYVVGRIGGNYIDNLIKVIEGKSKLTAGMKAVASNRDKLWIAEKLKHTPRGRIPAVTQGLNKYIGKISKLKLAGRMLGRVLGVIGLAMDSYALGAKIYDWTTYKPLTTIFIPEGGDKMILNWTATKNNIENSTAYEGWGNLKFYTLWADIVNRDNNSKLRTKNKLKEIILKNFYKEQPEYDEETGKLYTITPGELGTGLRFFDLVGSNFYLYLNQGEPHLIVKNSETIEAIIEQLIPENVGNQLPITNIYGLINQRVFFQASQRTIALKDRALTEFDILPKLKNITDLTSKTTVDHIYVDYEGVYDNVKEPVESVREAAAAANTVNILEYETLLINQQRTREDLALKRRQLELNRTREDIEWDYKWEEYNHNYTKNIVDVAMGAVTIGLGVAGLALGGVGSALGFLGAQGVMGAGKFAADTANLFTSQNMHYNHLKDQQQHMLTARLFENHTLDVAHHRKEYDSDRAIKLAGNIHNESVASTYEVMTAFNEQIGATEFHLRIYTPTDTQMLLIEDHYRNFGVECIIPDVTIRIDRNLSGVWQFDHIDCIETEDGVNHRYLEGMMINGIRLINDCIDYGEPVVSETILPLSVKQKIDQLENKIIECEIVEEKLKEQADDGRKAKKDLADLQYQYKQLQLMVDRVSGKDATEKLEQCVQIKKQLEDQNKTLTEEIEKEKAKLKTADEQLRTAAADAHSKGEEVKRLEKLIKDTEAAKTKCEKDQQRIQRELDVANRESTAASQKVSQLEDKVKELEGKIAEHTNTIQEANKNIQELNKTINDLNNKVGDLTKKKEELEGQLLEATRAKGDDSKKVQDLTAKKEELEGKLLEATNNIAKLTKEKEKLGDDLDTCIAERDTFKEGQGQNRQQLENRIAAVTADLNKKKQDIANQKTKIQSLTNQNKNIQRELIQARKDLEDKDKEIKRLEDENKDYETQIEECNRTQTTAEDKADQLEEERDKAREELAQVKEQLEEKTANLAQANKNIGIANQSVTTCTREYQKCKTDLAAANRNLETYRKSLADKEKELTTANNLVNLYKQEAEKCKKELETSKGADASKAKALAAVNKILDQLAKGEKVTIQRGVFTDASTLDEAKLDEINNQLDKNNDALTKAQQRILELEEQAKGPKPQERCELPETVIPDLRLVFSYGEVMSIIRCIARWVQQKMSDYYDVIHDSKDLYSKQRVLARAGYAWDRAAVGVMYEHRRRAEMLSTPYKEETFEIAKLIKQVTDNMSVEFPDVDTVFNRLKNIDCLPRPRELFTNDLRMPFFPSFETYNAYFQHLPWTEWKKHFSYMGWYKMPVSTTNERFIQLMVLYKLSQNTSKSTAERKEANSLIRLMVEEAIGLKAKERVFTFGQNIGKSWTNLSQMEFEYLLNHAPLFFQYIRDTWADNTGAAANAARTKPFSDSFSKFMDEMRKSNYKIRDWDEPRRKKMDTLVVDMFYKFKALNPRLDPYKKYRDKLTEMNQRQGDYNL